METKDILKELRKEKGVTGKVAAEGCGIPYKVYQMYESGQRNVGVPALCKLADYYTTSVDYLLGRTDIKEMASVDIFAALGISQRAKNVTTEEFMSVFTELPDSLQKAFFQIMIEMSKLNITSDKDCVVVYLPVSEAKVSAGTGVYVGDYNTWEKLPFIDTGAHDLEGCYVLCIKGDSMEPKFFDGDHIIVDPEQIPERGEIGIFVIGDEGFVKMLEEKCLRSLNDKYDDIPLTEDTYCCGKVLGTIAPA